MTPVSVGEMFQTSYSFISKALQGVSNIAEVLVEQVSQMEIDVIDIIYGLVALVVSG